MARVHQNWLRLIGLVRRAPGEICLSLFCPFRGEGQLISHRSPIPKVGLLKGVQETGLRIAFVLLPRGRSSWPSWF